MYQQLWGYKVEEKLYLGVREQQEFNTTDLTYSSYEAIRYTETYASSALPRTSIYRTPSLYPIVRKLNSAQFFRSYSSKNPF